MSDPFIELSIDNISSTPLCCIYRKKSGHRGVDEKKKWLIDRFSEGHIYRKIENEETAFIEYAPLEKAWVPIVGDNYIYIYCLYVLGEAKGKGYGKILMESVIKDAKEKGESGIVMLGSEKQKAWLSDQQFASLFGFKETETSPYGYSLFTLSFDGTLPHFTPKAKDGKNDEDGLSIYYSPQCPYSIPRIEKLKAYTEKNGIPRHFHFIDTLQKAKEVPSVFNNWAVFYNGVFQTINQIDEKYVDKLTKNSFRQ